MKTETTLQQQIALTLIPKIGRKRMRTVLAHTGGVKAFFDASIKELQLIPGMGEGILRGLNRQEALEQAQSIAEYMTDGGHSCYFFLDEDYPKKLNECEDAPIMLYGHGQMDLNVKRIVAIVGTRKATAYGKRVCEELIASFAGKNILVVSGLAYGIDIYVHQLCLQYGIQTVGVLGHGLDRVYPAIHRRTAKKMLDNGGLLTEFLPGTNPDRENFPMRNRIVAGMADATIVIESGISGGSLITAEFANDYARDVFAYPGNIGSEYSMGCNFLIQRNKAHLLTGSDDFFRMMEWQHATVNPKQTELFNKLNPEERSIIDILKNNLESSFELLIGQTNLGFADLSNSLLQLEFKGLIKPSPGKRYQLAPSLLNKV